MPGRRERLREAAVLIHAAAALRRVSSGAVQIGNPRCGQRHMTQLRGQAASAGGRLLLDTVRANLATERRFIAGRGGYSRRRHLE